MTKCRLVFLDDNPQVKSWIRERPPIVKYRANNGTVYLYRSGADEYRQLTQQETDNLLRYMARENKRPGDLTLAEVDAIRQLVKEGREVLHGSEGSD